MISRNLVFAASSLLAALPLAFAQSPAPAISMMTGPPVAAAATPAPAAGTTFTMNVAGVGSNATATAGSTTPAVSGTTKVWAIQVGSTNDSLTFSPNSISGANVGDMLQFQFHPNNHSVVMGDYNNACQPVQGNANAFYSGFMPTTAQGQLTYTVMVKDTNPIWLYCSQAKHCQEGMVAVINPPASGQTLADYKARAAMAADSVSPSSAVGGSSGSTTAGASGVIGATPSVATGTGVATTTSASTASLTMKTSSWSLAVVAVIAMAFF